MVLMQAKAMLRYIFAIALWPPADPYTSATRFAVSCPRLLCCMS